VVLFEVAYTDRRPTERVWAEWIESHGRHVVLMITLVVINQPRAVVALRVPIADVQAIYRVSGGA
jgi:hypothetical protein